MRTRAVLSFALFVAALAVMFGTAGAIQFKEVDAKALKAEMDGKSNLLVVDVRNKEEYAAGHLPGAVNIPPQSFKIIGGLLPRNKAIPIVFYCRGFG